MHGWHAAHERQLSSAHVHVQMDGGRGSEGGQAPQLSRQPWREGVPTAQLAVCSGGHPLRPSCRAWGFRDAAAPRGRASAARNPATAGGRGARLSRPYSAAPHCSRASSTPAPSTPLRPVASADPEVAYHATSRAPAPHPRQAQLPRRGEAGDGAEAERSELAEERPVRAGQRRRSGGKGRRSGGGAVENGGGTSQNSGEAAEDE